VPGARFNSEQHRERLRWEIEVILNGLATTGPEADRGPAQTP
jgi:hypothetical protein